MLPLAQLSPTALTVLIVTLFVLFKGIPAVWAVRLTMRRGHGIFAGLVLGLFLGWIGLVLVYYLLTDRTAWLESSRETTTNE